MTARLPSVLRPVTRFPVRMFERIRYKVRRSWRRLVERWAFQLVARTGPGERPPNAASSVQLPMPVGIVQVKTARERPGEIIFRRQGFRSEAQALFAGELLKSWLQVASALHLLSLDVGHDETISGVGEVVRQQAEADGMQVIPDVHGLVVVRQTGGTMVRISGRATGTVVRDWARVVTALQEASVLPSPLESKIATACALVSTAEHRSQHELQLLGFVTAAEILAEPQQREGPARELLEALINKASAASRTAQSVDRVKIEALCHGLQRLRYESLGSAARRLARAARPDDPAAAAKLMGEAYSARSAIIHRGARVDVQLVTDLRPLVQDMVRLRTLAPSNSRSYDSSSSDVSPTTRQTE